MLSNFFVVFYIANEPKLSFPLGIGNLKGGNTLTNIIPIDVRSYVLLGVSYFSPYTIQKATKVSVLFPHHSLTHSYPRNIHFNNFNIKQSKISNSSANDCISKESFVRRRPPNKRVKTLCYKLRQPQVIYL